MLIQSTKEQGVVGAGGAGFPAYVKLDCQVEYVLINAAECEPLLNKDQVLLQQHSQELISGIELVMQQVKAKQAIIGVKKKNRESIDILEKENKNPNIKILEMEDVYPAGDEVELVYEATKRRIPAGGLPKDIGVSVHNVESIINIFRASKNIPVTESMVTVHGEVENPYTSWLPIGISYREAIELAGGITCKDYAIIEGGPMMGSVTTDLDTVITKVSSGIIVIKKDSRIATMKLRSNEETLRIGKSACDQCSMCTTMCPRNLLGYPIKPHMAMRSLQASSPTNLVGSIDAQACSGCNLCTMWSCPEGLNPMMVCHLSKEYLKKNDLWLSADDLQSKAKDVHPMREYRGVPTKRLTQRLGLLQYTNKDALFKAVDITSGEFNIPLQQHIGSKAVPTIKVGDSVKKGQCIAKVTDTQLGCNVHASIAGKITNVDDNIITIKTV